jgi:hypothetical protein
MVSPKYLDLRRKFVELEPSESSELASADFGGKRVGWNIVLSRRASIIQAPANFGKTTELEEQASRLRAEGQKAVFVTLRRVRGQGHFESTLSPDDHASFMEWKSNPTVMLTVFLDSLDEASPKDVDDLSLSLALVTRAVNWPAEDVRWIISTRPALLTPAVVNQLRETFSRGPTVTATPPAASRSPAQAALEAAFSERLVNPEALSILGC